MKTLFIVDGNSIMNRAFFGVKLLQTKDGVFTNATYGTATMIYRQLMQLNPDYFAVAFDVHAPTFRHQMFDGYKANRHGMPDELRAQEEYVHKCFSLMGAHIIELPGHEADDILGTVSAMAEKDGDVKSYIFTGDRDSLQLISDKTNVILATNAEPVLFDEAKFIEKYGVSPSQFVDVKALMGDSSDNIPGVRGIGEKTALSLIAEYGSLDGIYTDFDDKKFTPSVKTKLADGKESAYMSQTLARIERDAPTGLSLSDIEYHGFDKAGLRALFERLEFSALIKKFGLDEIEEKAEKKAGFCIVPPDEIKKDLVSFYPDFENEKYYISDGENVSECDLQGALEILKNADAVALYDKKSLMHVLDARGVVFDITCDDVMIMGYVISASENDYSLDKLISRAFVSEAKSGAEYAYYISALHGEYLGRSRDVDKKLYRDIELPLCDVLYRMEKEGFLVDVCELEKFSRRLGSMQAEYEQRIFMQAGTEFNINSPKQLGVVLFEKMGLPSGKKTKSGYSTSAEVLEKLRPFSDIIDDILEYRQVGKLKSTYADGLTRAADENGRVHTSFRQALTATGRLSSTEPNLQNIPIKTDLGREFRRYFVASDGYTLIDADYSQIELRLLAAISGDENMIDAFNSGYDIHTATAMRVFGVSAEGVTVPLRKRAKAINFGIVYGMGDFSLAADLHVSKREAAEYIESYFRTYPGVRAYLDDIVSRAHKDKYVETLFGRRRYIPEISSTRKPEVAFGERVAMNSPIQGTAADIIKLAMVNVDKKLRDCGYDARLILQVHDELIIEAAEKCAGDVALLLKEEMENAVKLAVPLTVSIAQGKTWYDAK